MNKCEMNEPTCRGKIKKVLSECGHKLVHACKTCRDEFCLRTLEEATKEHCIFMLNHIEMMTGRKLDALQQEVLYDKIEADFKKNIFEKN